MSVGLKCYFQQKVPEDVIIGSEISLFRRKKLYRNLIIPLGICFRTWVFSNASGEKIKKPFSKQCFFN